MWKVIFLNFPFHNVEFDALELRLLNKVKNDFVFLIKSKKIIQLNIHKWNLLIYTVCNDNNYVAQTC